MESDIDQRRIDTVIPEGFEPIDLGTGFTASFGKLYLHAVQRKLAFHVAPHHLNPFAACHGGALATFADMQIVAVRPDAATRGGSPTISLSIDYLAPAKLDAWIEATVAIVKLTRTLVFTQALITADGEAVVRANAIYRNGQ